VERGFSVAVLTVDVCAIIDHHPYYSFVLFGGDCVVANTLVLAGTDRTLF
jgi:hypothetical protein